MSDTSAIPAALVSATVDVVTAYVAHNAVPPAALPEVIAAVHGALAGLGGPATAVVELGKPSPAEVRRSITPDALVSFLDGKRYKTLRRHLGTHGLTPEEYRTRYGLPADYPLVAPNYAAQRSELAKRMGLGQARRKAA